ncbi:hypothetical protein BDW22DRAFT_1429486 [Trametopsis cervina]|nr:hypothetical protein BDW22DRAFT_1429486 [Trametopsis cervina]
MAVLPAELIKLIFNQYSPVTTVTSTTPKDTHRTTAAQLYSQHEASLKEYFVVCSQVCRLWHDLSQPYLFTTLAIPFGTSAPSDLLTILAKLDAYPAPIKWVHHLRLVMRSPPPQDEYEGCDPQLLRALLYRFELARVVEMVDVVFRVSETEGYAESLQADLQTTGTPIEPNNRLEKISFSYPGSDCSPTVDTILYMLKWMGDVDEVNIEPYYWLHWTTRLTREDLHLIPTAFNVNTLNIVAYYLPDIFLQCLRGSRAFQDDAQGLKKLYFKAHGTSDQHLRMLLLPTSLKELHLDFDSFFDQGPRGELTPSILADVARLEGHIRDLKHLQKLTLKVPAKSISEWDNAWSYILREFSVLAMSASSADQPPVLPSLQVVTIMLVLVKGRLRTVLPTLRVVFATIDGALVQIPSVERVVIRMGRMTSASEGVGASADGGTRMTEEHRTWFRQHMTALDAKGLLDV